MHTRSLRRLPALSSAILLSAAALSGCGQPSSPPDPPDAAPDATPDALAPFKMVFIGQTATDQGNLYALDPSKSAANRLTTFEKHDYAVSVRVAPNGMKLAYVAYEEVVKDGYTKKVYSMPSTGEPPTLLAQSELDIESVAWSPDGKRVAFDMSDLPGNMKAIHVVDADGKNPKKLSSGTHDLQPVWSPDGTRIAFVRVDQGSILVTIDADGKNEKPLTKSPGDPSHLVFVSSPRWSPDGERIAFWTDRDIVDKATNLRNLEVYTVSLSDEGLTNVTNSDPRYEDIDPRWSPDGKTIMFVRTDRQTMPFTTDICVVSASGGEPVYVTQTPDEVESRATWSPEGTGVAFTRISAADPGGPESLWRADGSGQDAKKMIDASFIFRDLDWR